MNSQLLKLSLGLTFFVFGVEAMACSCMGIANAQQASSGKGWNVARVITQGVDADNVGTLTIQQVIKGSYKESTVKINGGDGASCGSGLFGPEEGEWVVIFTQGEDGEIYTAGCADASLKVEDATGEVSVYLGGAEVKLSEQDFSDFVNTKKIPTVQGVACYASVSRGLVNNYNKTVKNTIADINFSEELKSAPGSLYNEVRLSKDFSAEGLPAPYKLSASTYQDSQNPAAYSFKAMISEPFFGFSTSKDMDVNITKWVSPLMLDLTAYQTLDGKSTDNKPDQDPFYAFSAGAYCDLNLGLPLVDYQKPTESL